MIFLLPFKNEVGIELSKQSSRFYQNDGGEGDGGVEVSVAWL